MANFKLSGNSLLKLNGVKEELRMVVTRAIQLTKVDFGVIEGMRTEKRQKELLASGASQTMRSRHLIGEAVDLMAYVGSRGSWELNLYDDIAEAMKEAAIEQGTGILWGAAWTVPDIRYWEGPMEQAMYSYIDTRRKEGKKHFIDAPHFQLA